MHLIPKILKAPSIMDEFNKLKLAIFQIQPIAEKEWNEFASKSKMKNFSEERRSG